MNEETKLFDVLSQHTDEHDDICSFEEIQSIWKQYQDRSCDGPRKAAGKVVANRYVMAGLLSTSPSLCSVLLEDERFAQFEEILAYGAARLTQLSAANPAVVKLTQALNKGTIEAGKDLFLDNLVTDTTATTMNWEPIFPTEATPREELIRDMERTLTRPGAITTDQENAF